MSRKDSKGLFANVLGQLDNAATPAEVQRTTSPHLLKVAAGVRQIQERSELAERLLREGEQIIEINPEDIQASAIIDRFETAYSEEGVAELVKSMSEHGQSTPGLVRLVSNGAKRFQIVFGRRRLAAAKLLGISFKAVVRELSDEEAVVLQGEENSNRNDLSFIERCMFALAQERAGYGRDIICKSLNTGKSHVSEMLRLANALPRDIVLQIGAAPEIGRRRWVDFEARWLRHHAPLGVARDVLSSSGLATADSSARFNVVFNALNQSPMPVDEPPRPAQLVARGIILGEISHGRSGTKLTFNKAVPSEFVDFLATQIETLHEQFLQRKN